MSDSSSEELPPPDSTDAQPAGATDPTVQADSTSAAGNHDSPRRWWVALLGTAVFAVAAIVLLGVPIWQLVRDAHAPPIKRTLTELTPYEVFVQNVVASLTCFWFFALGASVGSFYKVLADRWPRGESVVAKPSYCPACGTRIRMRDNVPVLGWLLLGGRCRGCGAPIPLDYLVVEGIFGGVFLLLLFVEVLSGGGSVPVRTINHYAGVTWMIWYAKAPDLLLLYAFHLLLLTTLLLWSLFEWNRTKLPWPFLASVLAVAGVLVVAFPRLHPVPAPWGVAYPFGTVPWSTGLLNYLSGALAGIAAGGTWLILARVLTGKRGAAWQQLLIPVLWGAFLGWQATLALTLLSLILLAATLLLPGSMPSKRYRLRRIAMPLATGVTLLFLCYWRALYMLVAAVVS